MSLPLGLVEAGLNGVEPPGFCMILLKLSVARSMNWASRGSTLSQVSFIFSYCFIAAEIKFFTVNFLYSPEPEQISD